MKSRESFLPESMTLGERRLWQTRPRPFGAASIRGAINRAVARAGLVFGLARPIRSKQVFAALVLGCILLSGARAAASAAAPAQPSLATLSPGGFREITQTLDINLVFVGYEQGPGPRDIDEAALRAGLPSTYRAVNRYPSLYLGNVPTGLTYDYRYNVVYAGAEFEDAFFDYLTSIARPEPRTIYQDLYNAQPDRTATVGQNHHLDAPSVERWLAEHAGPLAGVDTARYTVFFINWHGRPDFKYHVYTKTDEPDRDTGFNHGLARDTRKLIAWGGTAPDDEEGGSGSLRRVWFYDLSAGPEAWTNNWNLQDADLGGDGLTDYRMPPVWEYGNLSGYRPFDDLSGDLGKVARYVAIDLLFTTSPLYKVSLSPPKLPSDIQLDINVYQGDPAVDGKTLFDQEHVRDVVGKLQPLTGFTSEVNDAAFSGRPAQVYDCWRTATGPGGVFLKGESCFGNRFDGYAYTDLLMYHTDHLFNFLEGDADYEVPIFLYNLPDHLRSFGPGAFAEENYVDGAQTYIFAFTTPSAVGDGQGVSATLIHEVGHHLGMSHPFDGYDYERNLAFWPSNATYFARVGSESNTVMGYLLLNDDFSQFDRDNMNRNLTSVYINQANAVLAGVYASPRLAEVGALLSSADHDAATALAAYQSMDYASAASSAKRAYEKVLGAAERVEVRVEPQAWPADYKSHSVGFKFADSVNDYRLDEP